MEASALRFHLEAERDDSTTRSEGLPHSARSQKGEHGTTPRPPAGAHCDVFGLRLASSSPLATREKPLASSKIEFAFELSSARSASVPGGPGFVQQQRSGVLSATIRRQHELERSFRYPTASSSRPRAPRAPTFGACRRQTVWMLKRSRSSRDASRVMATSGAAPTASASRRAFFGNVQP